MAKVKFGAMMVDARGKLGGHVFAKNRGGSYIRTKTTPSNPQSLDQSEVRSIFGSLSQGWSGLSAEDRATWNGAVDSYKTTDVFGDLKRPSGKALYQRLNQNLVLAGRPAIPVAPGLQDAPAEFLQGVDIDTALLTITLNGLATDAGLILNIKASGPVTQGTNNVSNRMRVIAYQDADASDPAALWTAYVAKFGVPSVGQKVVFSVGYILQNGIKTPLSNEIANIS